MTALALHGLRYALKSGDAYRAFARRFPRAAPTLRRGYWRCVFARYAFDWYAVEPKFASMSLGLVFAPLTWSASMVDGLLAQIDTDRCAAVISGQLDTWHYCTEPRPAAPMTLRAALFVRAVRDTIRRGRLAIGGFAVGVHGLWTQYRCMWIGRPRWPRPGRELTCWQAPLYAPHMIRDVSESERIPGFALYALLYHERRLARGTTDPPAGQPAAAPDPSTTLPPEHAAAATMLAAMFGGGPGQGLMS